MNIPDSEIEKKTEEVRDIIERMPTRWTGWIILGISGLIGTLLLLAFFIQYPDTVNGQISITAKEAPVRLVSNSAGSLYLLKINHSKIKRGTVIAYIDNGADYNAIQKVEKLLKKEINTSTILTLPQNNLLLGDLSTSYNNFLLSYQKYDQLRQSRLYVNMRKILHQQIEADSCVALNINEELRLKQQIITNIKDRLKKDSLLMNKGGISKADYHNQHNIYLNQLEDNVSLQSSHLFKLSEMNKSHLELTRINIEENEALQKYYIDLQTCRNELSNALIQWKKQYLLVSPINGELEYLGFWRENAYIQPTQELFTVLPEKNSVIGEVYISSFGAGKVKKDLDVNVKLNDFPPDEYGIIKGKVASVAKLTNKISTSTGMTEAYLVIVSFPNGLITNFDKHLSLNFETKGRVEIITKPKRLLFRLFDNLRAKGVK